MRVTATINEKDNLCSYCGYEFATCPKASHIKFGTGVGNDNVIECSEYVPISWNNNYPIVGKPELGVFPRGEVNNNR